jgi:hypothetical protein
MRQIRHNNRPLPPDGIHVTSAGADFTHIKFVFARLLRYCRTDSAFKIGAVQASQHNFLGGVKARL